MRSNTLEYHLLNCCRLFCGYNKTLRVFDTARPGREFSQYSTLTNTKDGQTGVYN